MPCSSGDRGTTVLVCLLSIYSCSTASASFIKCQRLEKPAHGRYIDFSYTPVDEQILPVNAVLWYTCHKGYQLFPKGTLLICLKDGSWSQEPPTCSSESVNNTGVSVEFQSHSSITRSQSEGKCPRLEAPEHGGYYDLLNYPSDLQTFHVNTILGFFCNLGYQLYPKNVLLVCLEDGGWSQQPPTCLKLCSPLFDTAGTKFRCYDENKAKIGCDQTTHGSMAISSCAEYFTPVKYSWPLYYCRDGIWNTPPMRCTPVCGKMRETTTPLILNGKEVTAGHYPWIAAIFIESRNKTAFLCGGTMLTQKIIVTNNQCLLDAGPSYYIHGNPKIKVAVGNYYNKLNDGRDTMAQYSDVQKIFERNDLIYSNILLFVTKDKLVLSEVVQPACFRNLPSIIITQSSEGIMAGWGFVTDDRIRPDELADVPISYMGEAPVHSKYPGSSLEMQYNYDKFYAGDVNSTMKTCRGTRGNGLVFKNPEDGLFYLHGITSLENVVAKEECTAENIFLFTKVSMHYEWLEKLVTRYE